MPKNAVQRLQDIENDIKTVISLYEVTNKSNNNNDKPETAKKQSTQQLPKIGTSKRLGAILRFDKLREVPSQSQAPFKKASSFITRPLQGLNSREPVSGKKWLTNKPGSAPTSTSTLSTICESDSLRQQPLDQEDFEKGVLSKAKTADNLNTSEWCDEISAYSVVMTPSKTLETAKEVLQKNNFNGSDESKTILESVVSTEERENNKNFVKQPIASDGKSLLKRPNVPDDKTSQLKKNLTLNFKITKKDKQSTSDISTRSRSVSPSEKSEHLKDSTVRTNLTPITSISNVTSKAFNSKVKSLAEISPPLNVKEGQRCSESTKMARKVNSSGGKRTSKSPVTKHVCFKTNKATEKEDNKLVIAKGVLSQRSYTALKYEEKFLAGSKLDEEGSNIEKDTKASVRQTDEGFPKNQETENYEAETWVAEFSKIIEKGNEKLEKMKVSKELALDIAKHFKNKYDDIQKYQAELLEKLQRVEENNERLNAEVRETKKLLEKTEDKNAEDKIQAKEINEENAMLKAKLYDAEKHHIAKIQELKKKIEDIQNERREENRAGLKTQEILSNELQQLTNEKSDLVAKNDELRRQMGSRKQKTQSLEENIRLLEEEVQKQKQHLKIKTETLHETNRELEMIRLNSSDLEEQVKMLRKSIEEFDGIQRSLIKKTTEYEQEIKLSHDKIKELQDENIRMKEELDNMKDDVLIKVKIIEDQQQTIRQLKEKSEEAKNLLKRNESLERILNIEREEKLELQEAVQRLRWRKEELKKKVKTLENDFLLAPQEVVRDLQKTQLVLHQLENQVQMKQKEWELQLHSLIREKEQACSVAEFATKKLMETTSEFHKQSEAYKGLQRMVAGNMAKEKNIYRKEHFKIHQREITKHLMIV